MPVTEAPAGHTNARTVSGDRPSGPTRSAELLEGVFSTVHRRFSPLSGTVVPGMLRTPARCGMARPILALSIAFC